MRVEKDFSLRSERNKGGAEAIAGSQMLAIAVFLLERFRQLPATLGLRQGDRRQQGQMV